MHAPITLFPNNPQIFLPSCLPVAFPPIDHVPHGLRRADEVRLLEDTPSGLLQEARENLLFAPPRKERNDHQLGGVLDAAHFALAEAGVADARAALQALGRVVRRV